MNSYLALTYNTIDFLVLQYCLMYLRKDNLLYENVQKVCDNYYILYVPRFCSTYDTFSTRLVLISLCTHSFVAFVRSCDFHVMFVVVINKPAV